MSPEPPNEKQMRAIHDMFNIQDEITVNGMGDLHIKGTGIRIGYFDGNVLFCENPVPRTLREHSVAVKEGMVGWHEEPQYDFRIRFDVDGNIISMSSNRMQMEVMFAKTKEKVLNELRCPECGSHDVSVVKTKLGIGSISAPVKLHCVCRNCEQEWRESR